MPTHTIQALALGAGLLASGVEAQGANFDGRWSVEVVTEKGSCDKAYRYPVIIENGKTRYGGPEGFEVSGSVSPNGAVSGSIARSGTQANVRGRLASNSGSGSWSTSGSLACSGRWNADKRG